MASLLKLISRFSTLAVTSSINRTSTIGVPNAVRQSSTLSNICRQLLYPNQSQSCLTSPSVSTPTIQFFPQMQQCRTYKVKTALKLRCSSCFFVKRHGRLFVECKAKPRHKQMQRVARKNLFKDDYTIGRPGAVERACFSGYKHDRYYALGNNKYSRHNWLEGKIGHTV